MDLLSNRGGAVLQPAVPLRKNPAATCKLCLLHVVGPRFIVLILTSTIVDYYLGIFLETATGRRRKLLLIVSLVVNIGILGFFKYYDFFAGSLAAFASNSSLVSGVANRASCRRQLLHIRQSLLHF